VNREALSGGGKKAGLETRQGRHAATKRGDIVTGRGVAYTQRTNTIVAIVVVWNEPLKTVDAVRASTVAHDCGLIINPDALRRVVECNVVQGLSRSIHEEVKFDRTGVKSIDWLTYPIVDITEARPSSTWCC